jgi:hypothetical protein
MYMKGELNKKDLWLKLRDYHFEALVPPHLWDEVVQAFGGTDASHKAFAHKIARKLDWPVNFAMWAIAEYKKFVYLGVISDFSVTPSKIIDQVWHEHILFTQGYHDFCENVIHYRFDHNPELLPSPEQINVFSAQYKDTLALYKTEFNMDPPEEIWAATKFSNKIKRNKLSVSRMKKKDNQPVDVNDSRRPLFAFFDGTGGTMEASGMGEFGGFGGGEFSGGGASDSFGDPGGSDSGGDSGGGGDGGGSSCSSGCGGGCGGG